jgi:hypothetical protein
MRVLFPGETKERHFPRSRRVQGIAARSGSQANHSLLTAERSGAFALGGLTERAA